MATNWSTIVKGVKIYAAEFNTTKAALKAELTRRGKPVAAEFFVVNTANTIISNKSVLQTSLKDLNVYSTIDPTSAGNIITKLSLDQIRSTVNVHEGIDAVGSKTSCGSGCTGLCAGCSSTCTGGCTGCSGCSSCNGCSGGCSGCNGRYF